MRRCVVFGLALALGFLVRAATDAIVLEGDYPNHLQDVWIADGTIWWAHTDWLIKTDLSGHIIAQAQVGGHHAGLEIRNGRLYTAVCAWNGEPRGETDATCHLWIGEYDADTLACVEMHQIDVNDRAGSLCILDDGSFLVGCLRHPALAPTEVKFHHLDASYNLIKTHVVDVGQNVTLGIETIHRDGEAIYLFMGGPTVRLDARTLEVMGKFKNLGGDRGFMRDGDLAWFGQSTQRASDKRYESKLVRKAIAWTYLFAPGTEVPRAFARSLDDLTVPLEDGTRQTLNAAVAFDAWSGGVVPSESDRAAAFAAWGDYAGWRTELVASFDRAIEANSLAICLCPAKAEVWTMRPLAQTVGSGEKVTLPLAEDAVSFRRFASDLSGIGCGVRNLSEANVGAAVTLELRLRETCSGETKTLARRDFRLYGGRTKPWFDGRIPNCESWPADAALALGGAWQAGSFPLAEVASRAAAGGLEMSGEGTLDFDLAEPKTLGAEITTATVNFELEFAPSFVNDLPTVAADWKGGVLIALDGSDIAYYGLAKVGAGNAWVKLDGRPPVFNGGPVHVQMTVRTATDGRATVSYVIDGEAHTYGGQTEIELVVPSSLGGVSVNGRGRILSLDGSYEKTKTGLSVFAW